MLRSPADVCALLLQESDAGTAPSMRLGKLAAALPAQPSLPNLRLQVLQEVLDHQHFMELSRTLFLAGTVWPMVARDGAILIGYAIAFFVAARLATRKRLGR